MPQPQVKAPREFKFVGGPSRKRGCRTGPGAAPRSTRPAPAGRPNPRPTSPQPTITVASEAPAAVAATGNVDVVSLDRVDRDPHPHLHSNSPSREHDPSGRLPNCSATSGAINTPSSAAHGPSAAAAATTGPIPSLARIESTTPAVQNACHYDGMEANTFLDWPSADQITASAMDDIGASASTTNLFTPFDSIFQMPFFPTQDQFLQDPAEPPGRGFAANNPGPVSQSQKDATDNHVDEIDLADTGEPGQVDDQDSPAFGHGSSGTGSSDSTESIDRNDDSYTPIIGNISEKFSRLFAQCKFIDRQNK